MRILQHMFPGTDNRGLSLIEIIIATFILAISSVSIYTVFRTATTVYSKAQRQLEMAQNARAILEQMTREIKTAAGASPGFDSGAAFRGYEAGSGIKSGSTKDEVYFRAIISNSDPEKSDQILIGYWLRDSDNTLMRYNMYGASRTLGSSNALGYNVTDLQFYYYYRNSSLNWIRTSDGNWRAAGINFLSNYDANGVERNPDRLPDSVEIILTVRDDLRKEQPRVFSTFVYPENSN